MKDPVIQAEAMSGALRLRDEATSGELDLEAIYDRYAVPLYRFALALLGSADDAEDAVQEVFTRIAREPRLLRKVESVRCYLFTAARNAAYGVLRTKQRRERLQDAVQAEAMISSAFESAVASFDHGELVKAFGELPTEQREVLALKVYEQMTFEEIARTLRVSQNTAASRYRYGIAKLRRALEVSDDGR